MKNTPGECRASGERGGLGAKVEDRTGELARLAFDQAVEAIVVCDEHGIVVHASRGARRLGDADPLLRPFADAFPLRAGTGEPLTLDTVLQRGDPAIAAASLDRNGKTVPLNVSASPLLGGQRVVGSVVTLTDCTDCKRADAALVASELRYRRLFEAARDGILILDAEAGTVVDVNPFLVELLGIPRAELLNKRIWELGSFKDDRLSESKFRELQENGYVRYDDLALETSDGRRADVEFVSNVYLVNGVRVLQCNVRDISERKRAEGLVKNGLDELERWQDVTLGREERVRELKREVNDLCLRAGIATRYPSQHVDPVAPPD